MLFEFSICAGKSRERTQSQKEWFFFANICYFLCLSTRLPLLDGDKINIPLLLIRPFWTMSVLVAKTMKCLFRYNWKRFKGRRPLGIFPPYRLEVFILCAFYFATNGLFCPSLLSGGEKQGNAHFFGTCMHSLFAPVFLSGLHNVFRLRVPPPDQRHLHHRHLRQAGRPRSNHPRLLHPLPLALRQLPEGDELLLRLLRHRGRQQHRHWMSVVAEQYGKQFPHNFKSFQPSA